MNPEKKLISILEKQNYFQSEALEDRHITSIEDVKNIINHIFVKNPNIEWNPEYNEFYPELSTLFQPKMESDNVQSAEVKKLMELLKKDKSYYGIVFNRFIKLFHKEIKNLEDIKTILEFVRKMPNWVLMTPGRSWLENINPMTEFKKVFEEVYQKYYPENCFDFLEDQESNILNYLNEDIENIVFEYIEKTSSGKIKTSNAVCSNLERLEDGFSDKFKGFYSCNKSKVPWRFGKRLYQLNLKTFNVLIPDSSLRDVYIIAKKNICRRFYIYSTPKEVKYTISEDARNGGSYISASHCQQGSNRKIYAITGDNYTFSEEEQQDWWAMALWDDDGEDIILYELKDLDTKIKAQKKLKSEELESEQD